jgi:cytidine deaminase
MTALSHDDEKLLETALKVLENAYVLWGCRVGAAVQALDNEIYAGCNVESWVSGLGVCAERCAIHHAVLHGNQKIKKIAIVIEGDHISNTRPCGACLQYIKDFGEPETKIIMAKAQNGRINSETIQTKTLKEMLPYSINWKKG